MTEQEWLASDDPLAMLRKVVRNGVPRRSSEPGGAKDWASDRKLRLFAVACCRQVWHLLTDERSRRAVEMADRITEGDRYSEERIGDAIAEAWRACRDARDATGCPGPAALAHDCLAVGNKPLTARTLARVPDCHGAFAALLRDIVGNQFRPVSLCGSKDHGSVTVRPYCGACQRLRTPTVLSLARAAYEERPGRECDECVDGDVGCPSCEGAGYYYDPPYSLRRFKCPKCDEGLLPDKCKKCNGTGRIKDGTLDPVTLLVLADALEEAGCDSEEVLRHLRRPTSCKACQSTGEGVDEYTGRVVIPGGCPRCHGNVGPHVRGCWAVDLVLGKE